MRSLVFASTALALSLGCVGGVGAVPLIGDGTLAFYNASLGTILNGTNPAVDDNGTPTFLFPNDNSDPNDPTFDPLTTEPDLSAAAAILGDWLGDPANLNAHWGGPMTIPATWTTNTETAIVYTLPGGATSVMASFGVDNGIFVWLDGQYMGGQMAPGGAVPGELQLALGDLGPGPHYLQILREDHGGRTGFRLSVTGDLPAVDEPGTLLLLGVGLLLVGIGARKRL